MVRGLHYDHTEVFTGGPVPNSLQSVEAAALELSPEEGAPLAQRLLASLPRDLEVEADWDEWVDAGQFIDWSYGIRDNCR